MLGERLPEVADKEIKRVDEILPPVRCLLCNAPTRIVPARFHLMYPQRGSAPVLINWWECGVCGGWFAYPVPALEVIEQHWGTVEWADPLREIKIARAKEVLCSHILAELSRWTKPGPLLDFGCNFGQFMRMAHEAGWIPSGFEPNVGAAETARAKGFDVRCGWSLQEAGFTKGSFAALTAIDVFCYAWDPMATLEAFHCLLKPGGVLAMRLTNKRLILGLVRAFSATGLARDTRISRILQGQFHSIGLAQLSRIVRGVGFDHIRILPHAMSAPWSSVSWKTRILYLGSDIAYVLSSKRVNLSPGVLLFARKAFE